jgi:serine/threonine protein kinase/Tol biopolymer transport system component/DNA-binding winged helix-turn-helix (wHTH) protein
MQDTLPVRVRLGVFELDLRAGELRAEDRTVRLQEQPFRILVMLLERAGEIVTRDEIQTKLWPNDTVVEFDHSINAAIKKLRQALNDSADKPQYIETIARRGYRLMVAAKPVEAIDVPRPVPVQPPLNLNKNYGRRATDKKQILQEVQVEAPAKKESSPNRVPANGTLIGKRVSHYRVLAVLGGGGMGMVYKAEDLKLGRPVALKFLPEEMMLDPVSLRRFEREAQTASSLDHPNICTIYEVEEHEGQPFLVMPLLRGETLRDRLTQTAAGGKTLPTEELLSIAIQICAGLQAAHDHGIVHRDIKPANIFITTSGQVKILDFGLAKLATSVKDVTSDIVLLEKSSDAGINVRRSAATDLTLTRLGVAIGTAGYMSPEQVRGEKLDSRSDLFSFGLVLYEMATGQRAFIRETTAAAHEAILNESPTPVRELCAQRPPQLERVINKALEKDRVLRYQSAAELAIELERLKDGRDDCGCPEEDVKRRWPLWLATSLVILLAGLAGVWFEWFRAAPLPDVKEQQLTANPMEDAVTGGAVSPDGKYVAYHDGTGLYLRYLESGETRPVALPARLHGRVDSLCWSPKGDKLLADVKTLDGFDIWAITLLGNEEPHLLYRHGKQPAISPDGRGVAFVGFELGRMLQDVWVGDIDGEAPLKLVTAGEREHDFAPAWSPDGRWIAYGKRVRTAQGTSSSDIEVLPAVGGTANVLVDGSSLPKSNVLIYGSLKEASFGETWTSDWRLVFSVTELPPSPLEKKKHSLWNVATNSHSAEAQGKPAQLTPWGDFGIANLTATTDGKVLSFLKYKSWSDIYLADLGPGGDSMKAPHRFTLDDRGSDQAAWSHDGSTILFDSDRNGKHEIFRQGVNEDVATLVIASPHNVYGVDTSPDGAWYLYWESEPVTPAGSDHTFNLMRRSTSGGAPDKLIQIPRAQAGEGSFSCSASSKAIAPCVLALHEGKDMVFYALDPVHGKGNRLGSVDTSGPVGLMAWAVSPDGSNVAMVYPDKYGKRIEILSLADGKWHEVELEPKAGLPESIAWAADGKSFFVVASTPDSRDLLHVTLAGKIQASLTDDHKQWLYGPLPSPDGKYLAFQAQTRDSNVWLIDSF